MIKGLYDIFARRWYRGGSIWLMGDPHFADKDIQVLRKNNISDVDLIKNINSCVSKNDTLIILGDVGDPKFVSQLRGYKVLIMGNHDHGIAKYTRNITEIEHNSDTCPICGGSVVYDAMTTYNCGAGYAWCHKCGAVKPKEDVCSDNHLFDEVYEGPLFIGDRLLLSHEPISLPYALNIHGHDHSKVESLPNCVNVCIEHLGYKPICLSKILSSGVRKNISTIHRITIDGAIERSKNKKKREK